MSCQNLLKTIGATVIAVSVIAGSGWVGAVPTSPELVVLVRHAEKESAGDVDPALSLAGMQRAKALVQALRDTHIDRIITSQFKRTRQTAAPLAEARRLTPVVVPAGANLQQHIQNVVNAIRAQSGEAVLVVGHTNTLPLIIQALGGPRMPELDEAVYATLFVLLPSDDGPVRLVRARYGAADAVAAP